MFQMISHGFLSAALFFLVGVIYDRVHDRYIYNFRGLATQMPKYTAYVAVAFFASLGLPGFSAFIGEAFVIIGAFNAESVGTGIPRWMAIAGSLGILLSAGYFLCRQGLRIEYYMQECPNHVSYNNRPHIWRNHSLFSLHPNHDQKKHSNSEYHSS